jgi:hypothetical protein
MSTTNQATFEFDTASTEACDRTGFELGWDHAHHGLVPPAELLLDGTPIGQGWRAAKAVFGRRTLAATRPVRQWLALRIHAWRRGLVFEGTQVTAHYLAQIDTGHCPVTRQPLGGPAGGDSAPVVERLQDDAGYAAGNLAVVSRRAADAKAGLDAREALRRAARIDAGIEPAGHGLAPAEHWRLAVLMSFVTALPFAEAARIPLRVLPPNRVRVLNAVQGLQALVTLQFSTPGWSARVRGLADLLPALPGVGGSRELRHDFNLFVGAVAPRLLEAGAGRDERATRRALEDAWADERVNRRWQHFVLALGEAATEALLQRAAAAGLAGVRTLVHEPAQATEGWSLASRGRVVVRPARVQGRGTLLPRPSSQPGDAVRS